MGIYLPPGSEAELESTGDGPLRLVAVRVPDPEPRAAGPGHHAATWANRRSEQATTEREFRIVADPATGLRSATHFVGYIPTERAPDHFHTYDEVIYVIDGEGVMEAGSFSRAGAPGSCIQLPARTVHCLSEHRATSRCGSSPCSDPRDLRLPPSIRTEPPHIRGNQDATPRGGVSTL